MQYLHFNLKCDRMISVRFQGNPFNITVIQVYALTSNAEEAEVEWFYEDLQDLLELTTKKSKMQYLDAISKRQNDLCSFPRQTVQYYGKSMP